MVRNNAFIYIYQEKRKNINNPYTTRIEVSALVIAAQLLSHVPARVTHFGTFIYQKRSWVSLF